MVHPLKTLGAFIIAAFCLWLTPAHAASSVKLDHVTLDISLEQAARPGQTVWIAMHQIIAPGWHSYWRNPGDSGLATSLSWVLPKGVTAEEPQWPTPVQFTTGPIVDYGYKDDVTLLVPLTIARDATIGPAQLRVFLLVCAQMCIPEQATLDLDLRQAPVASAALFARARAALPRGFRGSAHVASDAKTIVLTLSDPVLSGANADEIRFYPATRHAVDYDAPASAYIDGDTLSWKAPRAAHTKPFATFDGVLVVPGAGAFAVSAAPTPIAVPSEHALALTLGEAALLAFLGGLISI